MTICKYSQLKNPQYVGLDLQEGLDRWFEVPKNHAFKGLVSKNGNSLRAYQWVRKPDVKEHPYEGLIDTKTSDMSRAQRCTTCNRKIVHVFWVQDESGDIRPYGSEHLHTALGLSIPVKKTKVDTVIIEMQAEARAKENRKQEILKKANPDILKVNKTWGIYSSTPAQNIRATMTNHPFGDVTIKPDYGQPYTTKVYVKEGNYFRATEADSSLLEELGFKEVSAELKNKLWSDVAQELYGDL